MKSGILKNKKDIWLLSLVMAIFLTRNPFFAIAQVDSIDEENYVRTKKSIEVSMHKKDNTYTIQSLHVDLLPYPYLSSDATLKGKTYAIGNVISFLGTPLGYFPANELVITQCRDGIDKNGKMTGGCKKLPEGDTLVYIPYFNNGKYADIYDLDNKKILTIDLSSKATCNENNICEPPIEDSMNCASDCRNGEPVINTSPSVSSSPENLNQSNTNTNNTSGESNFHVAPEASQSADQSQTPALEVPWWKSHIVLIGLILAGIILIFWFFKDLIIGED